LHRPGGRRPARLPRGPRRLAAAGREADRHIVKHLRPRPEAARRIRQCQTHACPGSCPPPPAMHVVGRTTQSVPEPPLNPPAFRNHPAVLVASEGFITERPRERADECPGSDASKDLESQTEKLGPGSCGSASGEFGLPGSASELSPGPGETTPTSNGQGARPEKLTRRSFRAAT
jgi:hypothetical protein